MAQKTFRDYINESLMDLPEGVTPSRTDRTVQAPEREGKTSVSDKRYLEVPNGNRPPKSSSGSSVDAPGSLVDASQEKYLSDKTKSSNDIGIRTNKYFNSNTPIIGGVAKALDQLNDEYARRLTDWKLLLKGFKDIKDDPRTAYFVMNRLLSNGAIQPPAYDNDTAGVNVLSSLMKSVGLDKVFSALGMPIPGRGHAGTKRSYLSDKKNGEIIPGEDPVGNPSDPNRDYDADSILRIVRSKGYCPIFSLDTKKGTPTLDTIKKSIWSAAQSSSSIKDQDLLEYLANNPDNSYNPNSGGIQYGPNGKVLWNSLKEQTIRGSIPSWNIEASDFEGDKGGKAKELRNYRDLVDPYNGATKSLGMSDSIRYALETLGALRGYETFQGLSPRADFLWSVRLYPYSPDWIARHQGRSYPFDHNEHRKKDSSGFYAKTMTPALPITYTPYWYFGEGDKLYCGVREFDWERDTPVVQYQVDFGSLATTSLETGTVQLEWAESLQFNPSLNLQILDDADATFSKYMNLYLNTVINREARARAPLMYSSFVAELVVFKAALKVQYMFKFIVVPTQLRTGQMHMQGTNEVDVNSVVDIDFSIVGMLDYKGNNGGYANSDPNRKSNEPFGIDNHTWNVIQLTPQIDKKGSTRKHIDYSD